MTDWSLRDVKLRLISRHSYPVQMAFVSCTDTVCTRKGRQPFSAQQASGVRQCRTLPLLRMANFVSVPWDCPIYIAARWAHILRSLRV